jgi:hypothetical protein
MIDTDTGAFALVPLWLPAALYERRPKAGGTAIVVYVAMHRWTAGDDRTCHPSVKSIADEARVSITACKDALKLLREVGAVSWTHRYDQQGDLTSSDYTIHTARPRSVVQATDGSVVQATDGSVVQATSNQTQLEPDPLEPDQRSSSPPPAGLVMAFPEVVDHTKAQLDRAFEQFWKTYGNLAGTGKQKTRECWNSAITRDSVERIQTGLEAWVAYWRTPGANRSMYAQGFLNQDRWTTEPPPVAVATTARRPGRMERVLAMFDEDKTQTGT